MTDEAGRELLAAFIHTLEIARAHEYGRAALLTAHESGRRPTDEIIAEYREQCDNVEERVGKLRAMLATLSRNL